MNIYVTLLIEKLKVNQVMTLLSQGKNQLDKVVSIRRLEMVLSLLWWCYQFTEC